MGHDLAVARHHLAHGCCAVPPVRFRPLRLAEQHSIEAMNRWMNIRKKRKEKERRNVEVSIHAIVIAGDKARFRWDHGLLDWVWHSNEACRAPSITVQYCTIPPPV